MGYTRILQAGNQLEIYSYTKDYVPPRKRDYGRNKRRKRENAKGSAVVSFRRARSVQRAKKGFFSIVATNLQGTETVTFCTLTCYESLPLRVGYEALKLFFRKIKKKGGNESIRYIAVPEWQKRGSLHFHVLIWGIDEGIIKKERNTRNFQRCWGRGYADLRIARNNNLAIAGYMAKYLVKGLTDSRLSNNRAYSCSHNIKRPTKAGSNQLTYYMDMIVPVEKVLASSVVYETMWLGQCTKEVYTLGNSH